VARRHDVVVKAVGDEVLVYDLTRHRAHSLNAVAAAVWRRCDGRQDPRAIAAAIRDAEGRGVTEESVRYALAQLGRARLLTSAVSEFSVTRREWLRRLGTTAAVAVPVVTSIVSPTVADAQSVTCLPSNRIVTGVCSSDDQCCSGLCDQDGTSSSNCCVPPSGACEVSVECCGDLECAVGSCQPD
jgi:hypothetical protein